MRNKMNTVSDNQNEKTEMGPLLLQSLPMGKIKTTEYFKKRRNKFRTPIFVLGLIELIMGIIFIILAFVNLSIVNKFYYDYHFLWILSPGLWCAVPLLASGAVGIYIKKDCSLCIYNCNMALSIISAMMMSCLFILSMLTSQSSNRSSITAIQNVLAAGSFVTMVMCIVHSSFCCAGLCCIEHINDGEFLPSEQRGQRVYVQMSHGEYTLVTCQPTAKDKFEQPTAKDKFEISGDGCKSDSQVTQTPVEELKEDNQDASLNASQSTEI